MHYPTVEWLQSGLEIFSAPHPCWLPFPSLVLTIKRWHNDMFCAFLLPWLLLARRSRPPPCLVLGRLYFGFPPLLLIWLLFSTPALVSAPAIWLLFSTPWSWPPYLNRLVSPYYASFSWNLLVIPTPRLSHFLLSLLTGSSISRFHPLARWTPALAQSNFHLHLAFNF